MGTVMLLSLMASSIALSLYFMWKAFSVLPKKQLVSDHPEGAASVVRDPIAASLASESSAKP